MPHIKLDKFLFAYPLETGGLVVGWIHFILNLLYLVFLFVFFMVILFEDCEMTDLINEASKLVPDGEIPKEVEDNMSLACTVGKAVAVIFILIISGFVVFFAVISYRCIQGVKNRDQSKLTPMLIWMTIGSVLSVIRILSISLKGLSQGLIGLLVYGYSFVVIHSLRERFRYEFSQDINAQIYNQEYKSPPQYVQAAYSESTADPNSFEQQGRGYPQQYQQPQGFNQP